MKTCFFFSPVIAFPPREPGHVKGDFYFQILLILSVCASNIPHSTSSWEI